MSVASFDLALEEPIRSTKAYVVTEKPKICQ